MKKSSEGRKGVGEIHTHIGMGPSSDAADEVHFGTPLDPPDEDEDPTGGDGGSRWSRTRQTRERAQEFVWGARERAGGLIGEAGKRIERTGLIAKAQENPLTALGLAFAAGYLLAGSSGGTGRFGKMRQQLRGAVIGAVSAAVAQEARGLLGGEGGGMLASFFGHSFDEEDEDPFEDDLAFDEDGEEDGFGEDEEDTFDEEDDLDEDGAFDEDELDEEA